MPSALEADPDAPPSISPQGRSHPEPAPSRPIRVLIVDTAIAFGGTLVVARNLLKHLDPTVIDASLVSACADGFVSRDFAGDAQIRLLGPRIDYVTLGTWKRKLHNRFHWRPLCRILELSAIILSIIANVSYMLRLALLCRRQKIDIVHVNNFTTETLWTARLLRMPTVYHLHGHVSTPVERSVKNNFRHVRQFISISNDVTQSAINAGISPARIITIPNFVDSLPEATPPEMPKDQTIGMFGRITHWKGQKQFLWAALQVLPKFPQTRIIIVGDSSDGSPRYMEECREIARSSRFADRITFTGRVTDVTSYYKQCSIVVHASTDPEPFGMVLIEAMAQARPVIASSFGAASEIITDGIEGFIVNPNDTTALADRMIDLLSDPAKAKAMGAAGLNRTRAMYAPDIGSRQFEQIYLQIARLTDSQHQHSNP